MSGTGATSHEALALTRIRQRFVMLTALRWFPTGLVIPVLVLLMQQRGLNLATIGILGAAYSATVMALELPTGGLADVIGRRPILLVSAGIAAAAALVLAVGATAWTLAVGYIALGVSRALDSGPLQAWFVDQAHEIDASASIRRGLARAETAGALGLAVGALASGALVAISPFPTQTALLLALSTPFLVSAVISLGHAALVAVWVTTPTQHVRKGVRDVFREVPQTIATGLRLVSRHGILRRVTILTVGVGIALGGIELLAPANFAERLGGESAAATPYSVLVTMGFAGSAAGAALAPLAARVAQRPTRAMAISALTAAAALACVALPGFGVAATAYVCFYIALGVGSPLLDEVAHHAVRSKERATMLSTNSMALQAGGIVVSATIGALAQATSFAVSFGVLGMALALATLVFVRWPVAPVAAATPCQRLP